MSKPESINNAPGFSNPEEESSEGVAPGSSKRSEHPLPAYEPHMGNPHGEDPGSWE